MRRRKSDPEKLALGARLRQETTLTIKQIARLVALGSYGNANARLHQFMKTNGNKGHAGIRRRQSKHAKDKDCPSDGLTKLDCKVEKDPFLGPRKSMPSVWEPFKNRTQ